MGRDLSDRRDGSIPIYPIPVPVCHCVVARWWSGHVQSEPADAPCIDASGTKQQGCHEFSVLLPLKIVVSCRYRQCTDAYWHRNLPNYRGHATINLSLCALHHTNFTACRPAASDHVQRSRRTMTAEPSDSPTTTHHFPQKLHSTARVVNHFLSAFRSVI